ncbi:MAG: hypothetical protein ACJ71D_14875 [Nitrososphaera sp.]
MSFAVEISGNFWEMITTTIVAIAAVVDLGFTGYQIHENNQVLKASNAQQKESDRIRELQFLDGTFQQIVSTEERLFYELLKKGNDKLDPQELSFLFSRIEFLCFVINHECVKDKELLEFFKYEVIRWYDNWFIKYVPEEIVKNEKAFPSFSCLYNSYGKEAG